MTIHSSTLKKAEKHGFTLTEDARSKVLLKSKSPQFEFIGDDASDLLDGAIAAKSAMAEFGIVVSQANNGNFTVAKDGRRLVQGQSSLSDAVAEALDNLSEEDAAANSDEGDETQTGSVVPEKYKLIYAERGDPTNCGDWLALTFNRLTHIGTGSKEQSDPDKVLAVAEANGINDAEKYTRVKNVGWQGRLRMTVRNRLVKIVATSGVLVDPFEEKELKAPKEWMTANAARAEKPKPIADQATRRRPTKAKTRKAA